MPIVPFIGIRNVIILILIFQFRVDCEFGSAGDAGIVQIRSKTFFLFIMMPICSFQSMTSMTQLL